MEEPVHYVNVKTIEWDMMDKTKFFPLSMLSSFCVRGSLYPLTLIKTRLQVQKHGQMYTGKYRLVNNYFGSLFESLDFM